MATFVIAEAGVNHNGSVELALELVRAAAASGADAVKFQTFTADALVTAGAETVAYQRERTGGGDQHAMLKSLELAQSDYSRIAGEARRCGIEFMSTAFDEASAAFLVELGIRRIKIPSGEITNEPFLKAMAGTGLPVILSTGMADLAEVRSAVEIVREAQAEAAAHLSRQERLVVLQCTSAYPTPVEDANLAAMTAIARELDVPVGFSDHTLGTLLAPVAAAMGARVIEKHFTMDRSLEGPDHAASLEPAELAAMISDIRAVETALGDGVKAPRPSEMEARTLVRRGIKAACDISAGEIVAARHLAILRPATGLPPGDLGSVIGRAVRAAKKAGEPLTWADFER